MAQNGRPCIGIDLGTTYSCVGVWQDGRVEIIANAQGNRTTPSYVAFTEGGERLIGDAAKNQASTNPTNTVFDAKRLIGRQFNDATVASDIRNWPFRVVAEAGSGKPLIQVTVDGHSRSFKPEEISAMVLSQMKQVAEAYLGHPVHDAVVTVPAYFNDAQRNATKDAGTIAGLNVKRIINEPTAAAIAYGLEQKGESDKNILIFDLGGGTFDVSLLSICDGIFEVKATAGDTHLGGEDFDNRLVDYFVKEFKKKSGVDVTSDPRAVRRLRTACERAKRVVSTATQATIELEAFSGATDFFTEITRARFEELCKDLFAMTIKPVEQVLADSKMDRSKVSDVVLVGGSTRIPKVQELLSKFFKGKELCKSINPDEAVAYGAAVQGAVLSGRGGKATQDILLLDVTPLSLGIETEGKKMSVLIPRNTTIPAKVTEPFTTTENNQTEILFRVFEGERPLTSGNNLLGQFELKGIAPAPREVPKINVTFSIDANGMLYVQAEDSLTSRKADIVITNNQGRLSKAEIERMLREEERFRETDAVERARLDRHAELESLAYRAKTFVSGADSQLPQEAKTQVSKAADETLKWLKRTDASRTDLDEELAKLTTLLRSLNITIGGDDEGDDGAGGGGAGKYKTKIEDVD